MSNDPNWQNLVSLYKEVATLDLVSLSEKGGFSSLKINNSAWPNLNFLSDRELFNTTDLVEAIDQGESYPLLVIPEYLTSNFKLKDYNFSIIDFWMCMDLDMSYWKVMTQKKIPGFTVQIEKKFQNDKEWFDLVSLSLFNNKPLSSKIFLNLDSQNNYQVSLRNSLNEIVGTAMFHIDSKNNPGIYMVTIQDKYRGLGLGMLLIQECISHLKRLRLTDNICYLQSTRNSINFYKKLGFSERNRILLFWKKE